MAIPTFIQKTRINEVIYQIQGDELHVSARSLTGGFKESRLRLHDLNPDYLTRSTRNYALLLAPLFPLLVCSFLLVSWMRQTSLPEEVTEHFVLAPAIGFATSLAAVIRGIRRINYILFNSTAGTPMLSIIREPEQAEECAGFVATLVAHIQITQANLSPGAKRDLLRSFSSDKDRVLSAPNQELWAASLVLGLLASGLPWIPAIRHSSVIPLFPIIFLLCCGATAFCIYSFMHKEPGRWWSVLGLIAGLIPPIFY